jgi:hypothetical protein
MIIYLSNPDPRIPENLRETYAHLVGIVLELLRALNELEVLFNASKEAIALMNQTAPDFFMHHRELLVDHIILSVSRLTDNQWGGPPENRKENLTLPSLLDLEPKHRNLQVDLCMKLAAIKAAAKPLRLFRNKVIAHTSKVERLSPAGKLADRITFKSMKDLIGQINDYLVTFDCFFTKVNAPLQCPASLGNANDLLTYLQCGLDAEKKQREEAFAPN